MHEEFGSSRPRESAKPLNVFERIVARFARAAQAIFTDENAEQLRRVYKRGLPEAGHSTPLLDAVHRRDAHRARALILKGDRVHGALFDNLVVDSPLVRACVGPGAERAEIFRIMLDAGARPDARVKSIVGAERGLLTMALEAGAWDNASALLSRMRRPLAMDGDGVTPVLAATLGLGEPGSACPSARDYASFENICDALAKLGADFDAATPEMRVTQRGADWNGAARTPS